MEDNIIQPQAPVTPAPPAPSEDLPQPNDPFGGLPTPPAPPAPVQSEDDDMDLEEKQAFQKMIDQSNASRDEEIRQLRVSTDLNNLYAGKYGKVYQNYDGAIRKALQDPRAKGLPVSAIANSVVPIEAFARAGAEAARESDRKSKLSGGSSGRPGRQTNPGATEFDNVKNASDRSALADRIKRGEVKIFPSNEDS